MKKNEENSEGTDKNWRRRRKRRVFPVSRVFWLSNCLTVASCGAEKTLSRCLTVSCLIYLFTPGGREHSSHRLSARQAAALHPADPSLSLCCGSPRLSNCVSLSLSFWDWGRRTVLWIRKCMGPKKSTGCWWGGDTSNGVPTPGPAAAQHHRMRVYWFPPPGRPPGSAPSAPDKLSSASGGS